MKNFFILISIILLVPSTAISKNTNKVTSPLKRKASNYLDIITPGRIYNTPRLPLIVSISHEIKSESFNPCNERIFNAVTTFSSNAKGNLFFLPGLQLFSIESMNNMMGPDHDQEIAKVDVHGYYYEGTINRYNNSKSKYECEKGKRYDFRKNSFKKNSSPLQSGGILPAEDLLYNGYPFFDLVIRFPRENNFEDHFGTSPHIDSDDFPGNANIFFKSPSINLEIGIDLYAINGEINSKSKLKFSMTPPMLEHALRKGSIHRSISWLSQTKDFKSRNKLTFNIKFGKISLNWIYRAYANCYGLDWLILKGISLYESSENPKAVNRSFQGLFQIGKEYCKEGIQPFRSFLNCTNRFDVEVNTAAASTKINRHFRRILKYCPKATLEDALLLLYVGHNQGGSVLKYLLNNKACSNTRHLSEIKNYYCQFPNCIYINKKGHEVSLADGIKKWNHGWKITKAVENSILTGEFIGAPAGKGKICPSRFGKRLLPNASHLYNLNP